MESTWVKVRDLVILCSCINVGIRYQSFREIIEVLWFYRDLLRIYMLA